MKNLDSDGQARKDLEEMGRLFHGAIPTVITGKNHKIESTAKGQKIAIPFTTNVGTFTIVVCLENKFDKTKQMSGLEVFSFQIAQRMLLFYKNSVYCP